MDLTQGAPRFFKCSEEEFKQHADDYDGLCLACGEWSFGGVEPDAMGYECEACGKRRVIGAEQALLLGRLIFAEEEAE